MKSLRNLLKILLSSNYKWPYLEVLKEHKETFAEETCLVADHSIQLIFYSKRVARFQWKRQMNIVVCPVQHITLKKD